MLILVLLSAKHAGKNEFADIVFHFPDRDAFIILLFLFGGLFFGHSFTPPLQVGTKEYVDEMENFFHEN